jgi:hypothetical protein
MHKTTISKAEPRTESQVNEVLGIFEQFFPAQVLQRLVRETRQKFYTRLLPPLLILWGFIYQRLNGDHTCDAAWSYLSSEAVQQRFGLRLARTQPLSESTSAYVQARQRLPLAVAQKALRESAERVSEQAGAGGRWHGYRVNLFDGSTILLSAAPALVEHYGTYRNQHGPLHWPLMRLVAGFDFFSGAANGVAEGPYGISEHPLAAELIGTLGAGWLHIGDRYLGVYHILQAVSAAESEALLRLNQRTARCLAGRTLESGADLDVVWNKERYDQVEADLPTPEVSGRLLYVRLEKAGFRPIDLYLFTTLTDRQAFPLEELVALCGQRWNVELDLRHVKATLQMERLDGHSVEIVRKELLLGLLAYNLLRGLMTQAALQAGELPCQLSLAQCWRRTLDACRGLSPDPSQVEVEHVLTVLLGRLGRCLLPKRKRERFEPRAVWGQPQVYPRIKGSREEARQAQLELLKNNS